MEKLAIHGGTPVRKDKIYYGRQYIDEDDCNAVRDVLLSDLITTGPKAAELEKKLCDLTGAKYAVAVANGTASLHAACLAAGIKSGDEVITTALTFAASANCVLYCGGTPVFADVDPETFNISPASILDRITARTRAVIPVDFTGQAAQLDKIKEICKSHNLVMIEDASHSIGTKFNGVFIGNIADMTTFSFHPVKTITGGEGGAILTNDETLYRKLVLYRTHGITRNPDEWQGEPEGLWYYEQIELGYNYRITDFQSALLISQLNKLERFASRRKAIVKRYNEAFSKVPEITLQKEIQQSDTVQHLYIIKLNLELLRCTRRMFFDAMNEENITPNVHYIPVYYLPYYRKLGYKKGLCPQAESLYEKFITLPLYYSLTDYDVESVIQTVLKVTNYYRKGDTVYGD